MGKPANGDDAPGRGAVGATLRARERQRGEDKSVGPSRRARRKASAAWVDSYHRVVARVFISHTHEQGEFARALARYITEEGMEPWLALDRVRPGEAVARAVQTAAQSSDAAVLIVGPQPPTSWVRNEWSVILDAHWRAGIPKLVAVLLDDPQPVGFLSEAEVIRAPSAPATWDKTFRQVTTALRRDSRPTDSEVASHEELRARLDAISGEVRASEPDAAELEKRAAELRNLITHAETGAVSPADRARLLLQLAALDMHLERHGETERLLREASELLASERPSETTAFILYNLGVAVLARDAVDEAFTVFREAFQDCQAAVGPSHPLTAATAFNLGRTLSQLGRPEDARQYFETAVDVGSRTLGQDHEAVRGYSQALAGLAS